MSTSVPTDNVNPLHVSPEPRTVGSAIINILRGAAIGMAELVPGVSGGTLALVVGIYEKALASADNLTKGKFKQVDWFLLGFVALGMFGVVFTMAGVMANFVENHSVYARGLFFGMVALSILVPIRMIDKADFQRLKIPVLATMAVIAVFMFWLSGLGSTTVSNPPLWIFFPAAAIAVCALVLPGVSGSFLLLVMGLYTHVLDAVDQRNFALLAVFALGAITGLALFIKVLTWMLSSHRTLTLAAMTGFLIGSLRALWPWQDANRNLQAPSDPIWSVVGLILVGAALVGALLVVEKRYGKTND